MEGITYLEVTSLAQRWRLVKQVAIEMMEISYSIAIRMEKLGNKKQNV